MGVNPTLSEQCSSRFDALVMESIANADTRAVLIVLNESGQPLPVAVLAEEAVATASGKALWEVTAEERRRRKLRLHHSTLPCLESLGLIKWDTDRGTVELADTSSLDALGVDLATLDADTDLPWEAISTVLAVPRRKSVLRAVKEEETLTVAELAAAVAARRHEVPRTRLTDEQVTATRIALQHADLPKLAEVGLLEDGWREGSIELRGDRLAELTDSLAIVTGGSEPTE